MTHPLTPREKVAELIYDRLGMGSENSSVEQVSADIVAALASGSGDHAGLARSVGKAIDANIHRTSRLYSVRTGERRYGVGGQAAATDAVMAVVSPLLAEIAALRETADVSRADRKMLSDMAVQNAARATEAERKLAEAVGHMSWMRNFVPTVWGSTEGRLSEIDDFLSKEAERG